MIVNPFIHRTKRFCDSADFDHTNDYMTRGAGLTGAADSKLATFVLWFRKDGSNATQQRLFGCTTTVAGGTNRGFRSSITAANKIDVVAENSSGTTILSLITSGTFSAGAAWHCVMCSVDLSDSAKRHLYVDDVSDLVVTTYTNDTIDHTVADHSIGANPNNLIKMDGCLAEVWIGLGQYIDFSIEENRRKFRSSDGKPVNLGTNGAVPTGTAPLVYLSLDRSAAVAGFATNKGTGGNFTISGTLHTGSSSPSD